MNNIFTPATTAAAESPSTGVAESAPTPNPRALSRLGGAALIAAPLLLMSGALTSPAQTAPGEAGYIESLARDVPQTLLSANLFHYGWVALALGALAALALIRGSRGRVWVSIAAVVLAFGSIQMSGLLLSDWFLSGAGTVLPLEDALAMDTAAKEGTAVGWLLSGQLAAVLGIPALTLGLARARVLSWWVAPLAALPFVVLAFNLGALGALLGVTCFLPLFLAGGKLVAGRS